MKQRKASKQWERPSSVITFSCPEETEEFLDERVKELKPMVSSRSHYLLRLIEADRKGEIAVFPKDDAQAMLPGIAA